MAELVVEIQGKDILIISDYLSGLIYFLPDKKSLSIRVEGTKFIITGKKFKVQSVKKYIVANLKLLNQIRDKIGLLLKSVEEAEITQE